MNVTVSDVIATLALLIASLAAVYARWSAKAAQNANRIALHDPKVNVYLELRKFQNGFRGFLAYPSEQELESFYENVVVLSELYFPPFFSKQLNELYDECWQHSRSIRAYENEEGEDEFHQKLIGGI